MKNELSLTRYPADLQMMASTGPNGCPSGLTMAGAPAIPAVPACARRPARDRRLAWLLLAAWIINLFDLGLTMVAWRQNLMVELNPLAAKVLPHGAAAIVVYKLGLLLIGTSALWYCRRHWATEPAVWAYVILCFALSLWWHRLVNELHVSWADYSVPTNAQPYIPQGPLDS